jgi:pilin isopeptide linkage protein
MKCFKGVVEFPKLCFTAPGEYRYTIRELTESNRCWLTDNRVYHVIITITENRDGRLEAEVKYPCGEPKFVNRYCPPECCCCCRQ